MSECHHRYCVNCHRPYYQCGCNPRPICACGIPIRRMFLGRKPIPTDGPRPLTNDELEKEIERILAL